MVVETSAISAELERVAGSKEFASSPRLVRFLRYCVEQSEAGRLDGLKESVVGVQVFDRVPGYDPKLDPIVRVHARRLREKLVAYYQSAEAPEIAIRIPKGGYVAHFEPVAQVASGRETFEYLAATHVSDVKGRPNRARPLVLTLLAMACLFGVLTIAATMPLQKTTLQAPRPLVSLPGATDEPAWSPDGKTLAFVWDGGNSRSPQIYLLKKGDTVPARLTDGLQPEYRPTWSPDGTQIALLRAIEPRQFALTLVDVARKTEHLVRVTTGTSPTLAAPALDWSADGDWLVSSEQGGEGHTPVHLLLISPKDGRSWVITDPPNGSTGDLEARFSPDGKRIVFRRGGHGELFMIGLNGTTATPPVQVTFQNGGVWGLALARDGKTIYYGSQRESGNFGLWQMREGGRGPVRLTPENITAINPALSPDGHSIAFAQQTIDLNLWLYGANSGSEPRLLFPSVHAEYAPEFSPDGRRVAFVSDRSGAPDIWVSELSGGQPRKVTSLREGDLLLSPSWSPDGKTLAFFCRRSGVNYAFETDVATGATRPLKEGANYALSPAYSLDGKSLYYVSNAEHRFRIWRQPLATDGPAEPVTADDVRFFRLSKDRRHLYFIRPGRPDSLAELDLSTRELRVIYAFPDAVAMYNAWDVAGSTLFYLSLEQNRGGAQMKAVDLISGTQRVLGSMRRLSHEGQTGLSASPDGQSVLATQLDNDDTRLMVLRVSP